MYVMYFFIERNKRNKGGLIPLTDLYQSTKKLEFEVEKRSNIQ